MFCLFFNPVGLVNKGAWSIYPVIQYFSPSCSLVSQGNDLLVNIHCAILAFLRCLTPGMIRSTFRVCSSHSWYQGEDRSHHSLLRSRCTCWYSPNLYAHGLRIIIDVSYVPILPLALSASNHTLTFPLFNISMIELTIPRPLTLFPPIICTSFKL